MGGYGSGRWGLHSSKDTVEECLIIDINGIVRLMGLSVNLHKSGILQWSNTHTGEVTSRIQFEVNTLNPESPWLRLFYTRTRDAEEIDYHLQLTTTRQNFGGVRWWFICPLVINNYSCMKRVGKIYLPPQRKYFGCRHCYDLTYTSCLESRKYDSLYARIAVDMPGMTKEDVKRILSS